MIELDEFNSYLKYGKGVRMRRAYLHGKMDLPGWYIYIDGDDSDLFIGDKADSLYHSAESILWKNHPYGYRFYWVYEKDVQFDNLGILV